MPTTQYPLLSTIDFPLQLRQLSTTQLPLLAAELREFLLHTLNQSGGHLAANLGSIELTIALHYVLNTPEDRLVWDIGHQAYAHKVLTGRREQLVSIRQNDGLAPFPSRYESQYDSFGVGHASTSISAALGMAIAAQQYNNTRKTVAIIGDGAMTAGIAFEALNHAGALKANLLVILNDNEMSISDNVGALANYFARLLSGKCYTHLRESSKKALKSLPVMRELARRTEEHVKGMLLPGSLFEELGFNYIGPIDGHDLSILITSLRNLYDLQGPQLLHVVTKKGKGYPPAETDPIGYHAVNKDFLNPKPNPQTKSLSYANVFGEWICEMAALDNRLIAITPAMREGSDLVRFSQQYPQRYFDVGIAEQHAVTLAASLASEGLKPVLAIYSTFLQRGYDQLIHDVALQNLAVLLAIDRGGLVGGDGETHHGHFDLSYLRCLPNMLIMTASDENELRNMLYTGFQHSGPCAVRYPRGSGPGVSVEKQFQILPLGKAEIRRPGQRVGLLAFGSMLQPALQAAEELDATVVNMRFVKPLDKTLLAKLATEYDLLVSLEENSRLGGAGGAIGEYLHDQAYSCPLLCLGLPDNFVKHGDTTSLLATVGLDAAGIVAAVKQRLAHQ